MVDITKNTVACFIERKSVVKSCDKYSIGGWLKAVKYGELNEVDFAGYKEEYKRYIQFEVTSASSREGAVWDAVRLSDHIWCQSLFIGDSAELCSKMLSMAEYFNIENKIFFNLADRAEAMHNLLSFNRKAGRSMRWLATKNNVRFYFEDEIQEMVNDHSRIKIC